LIAFGGHTRKDAQNTPQTPSWIEESGQTVDGQKGNWREAEGREREEQPPVTFLGRGPSDSKIKKSPFAGAPHWRRGGKIASL